MKFILKFITLGFVLVNCSNKNNHDLKGNWMVIESDSTYYEIFYTNKTTQICFEGEITKPLKYQIKKDSLIIFNSFLKKNFKHLIYKKDGDTLIILKNLKNKMRYIKINNNEFTLNKIQNKKDYNKYVQQYFKRREKFIADK